MCVVAVKNSTIEYPLDYTCNCTGTYDYGESNSSYICNDYRLGSKILPRQFPVLSLVTDYNRFGSLSPGEFLKTSYNYTGGHYNFVPNYGFLVNKNGMPIMGRIALPVGTLVDRFGAETGQ